MCNYMQKGEGQSQQMTARSFAAGWYPLSSSLSAIWPGGAGRQRVMRRQNNHKRHTRGLA